VQPRRKTGVAFSMPLRIAACQQHVKIDARFKHRLHEGDAVKLLHGLAQDLSELVEFGMVGRVDAKT
jgi:hypothetical protein